MAMVSVQNVWYGFSIKLLLPRTTNTGLADICSQLFRDMSFIQCFDIRPIFWFDIIVWHLRRNPWRPKVLGHLHHVSFRTHKSACSDGRYHRHCSPVRMSADFSEFADSPACICVHFVARVSIGLPQFLWFLTDLNFLNWFHLQTECLIHSSG